MVSCTSTNPVLDELWKLKKQVVRRQSPFHPHASATKAHIQISHDDTDGSLVKSYKDGSYFFGVKPIVHRTNPKSLSLLFASGPIITINTVERNSTQYFTVAHNDRQVYRCIYNDPTTTSGAFLNIIIDADRFSFAETPFSTCTKVPLVSATTKKRYSYVEDSPIIASSKLSWFEAVDTSEGGRDDDVAVASDSNNDDDEDDEDDEEEGLFMSPIFRQQRV